MISSIKKTDYDCAHNTIYNDFNLWETFIIMIADTKCGMIFNDTIVLIVMRIFSVK